MSLADKQKLLSSIINQLCSDWAQLMQITGPGNKHYSGEKCLSPAHWLASNDIIQNVTQKLAFISKYGRPYWSQGFPSWDILHADWPTMTSFLKYDLCNWPNLWGQNYLYTGFPLKIYACRKTTDDLHWSQRWVSLSRDVYGVYILSARKLGQHAVYCMHCGHIQQTLDVDPMWKQCWATVYAAGPTLVWWIHVSVILPVLYPPRAESMCHCSGNRQGYPRVRYFSNNIFTT